MQSHVSRATRIIVSYIKHVIFKIKRVAWVEPTTSLEDFFENSINTQPGGFSKYPLPKSRQHTVICHDINDILKAAGIIMHVHALFCLFRSYCETLSRQNEPTQTQTTVHNIGKILETTWGSFL